MDFMEFKNALYNRFLIQGFKISNKYNGFGRGLEYHNKTTGESCSIGNFVSRQKNYNRWILQKINALQHVNSAKFGVFFTLTLPSEYHPYSNNGRDKNVNFTDDVSDIDAVVKKYREGYKLLNTIFRQMYKATKQKLGAKTLSYCLVYEPHKSFVPHCHGLFWFDSADDIEDFRDIFYRYIKKFNLTRVDFQMNLRRSDLYLVKYIHKFLKSDDTNSLLMHYGWRSACKIVAFHSSREKNILPKYVFQKGYLALNYYPKLKELVRCFIDKNGTNFLIELSKIVSYSVYSNLYGVKEKLTRVNAKLRPIIELEFFKKSYDKVERILKSELVDLNIETTNGVKDHTNIIHWHEDVFIPQTKLYEVNIQTFGTLLYQKSSNELVRDLRG
jgi:hypothetical protein